jgi:dolichol-phosphate mannosyltransferase
MPKGNRYLIIVPAYNEQDNIEELVIRAHRHADVCVVDDCSRDKTPEILNRLQGTIAGLHVLRHARNTHYAGAITDAIKYALEMRYDYGITMDAGLSHNPDEIPRFMDEALDSTDLLIGSRTQKLNTPMYRRLLSFVGNLIYNISLDFPYSVFKKQYYGDITSGFRRYSNRAMRLLISRPPRSRSIEFVMESAARLYRSGMTIREVPITYRFTNSSLSLKTVKNCLSMSAQLIFQRNFFGDPGKAG